MEVVPWDVEVRGNIAFPVDENVHFPAVEFCKAYIETFDRRLLNKAWIVREGNKVLGVTGVKLTPDVPAFRSIHLDASRAMASRLNSYFADLGYRGHGILINISDSEIQERRCPNRDAIISEWGAIQADRYVATCR